MIASFGVYIQKFSDIDPKNLLAAPIWLVTFFPGHNASGHLSSQPAMIGNRS